MKKHTPGPWSISLPRRDEKYGYTGHGIYAAGGKWVGDANGEPVRVPADEIEGNALLMAESPNLLATLEEINIKVGGLFAAMGHGLEISEQVWDEAFAALEKGRLVARKARGGA